MKNAQNAQTSALSSLVSQVTNASVKPVKPASAKPAKQAKQAKQASNAMLTAIQARITAINAASITDEAKSSQTKQLNGLLKIFQNDALLDAAVKKFTKTDFARVYKTIATCDEAGKGIEQVKSIVKILDVLRTITQDVQAVSNNINVALKALLSNGNSASVSELIVAQSSQARESKSYNIRENYHVRSAGYSKGTGISQTSQVRQVLNVLGFAAIEKGKKNDVAQLNDYGLSMLKSVYSRELISK